MVLASGLNFAAAVISRVSRILREPLCLIDQAGKLRGQDWGLFDTHHVRGEGQDFCPVAALARGIFWLVLPSLVLFITLPMLLDRGVTFVWALLVACGLTAVAYGAMMMVLPRLGVNPG